MTVRLTAGSTIAICATAQATPPANVSAYAALTYIAIGEVQNLGSFGDKFNITQFAAISDARTRKLKGTADAGTLALMMGRDPLDLGQAQLRTSSGTKFDYAFKVVAADRSVPGNTDSVFYFTAGVNGAQDQFGSVDQVTMLACDILINSVILYVPAT